MMLSEDVAPPPAMISSCPNRSSAVFTGAVCQVTQVETSLVMLPSQVNLVPSNCAFAGAGVSSGVEAIVRPKVPKAVPSLGATE